MESKIAGLGKVLPKVIHVEAVVTPQQSYSVDAIPLIDEPSPMALPPPDEVGARNFLSSRSWPRGLQDLFIKGCQNLPIRFIIVDDSGSMTANDGRKLLTQGDKAKYDALKLFIV